MLETQVLHLNKSLYLLASVKCTRTHTYYVMKSCNGDAEALKAYVVNIIDHYKVYIHMDKSQVAFFPCQWQQTHEKRLLQSKKIKFLDACYVYFYSNRVIILNAMKSRDPSRRAKDAARNLLLVKGLLLHTGKLLKGPQSTKMLLIMQWYYTCE